MIDPEVKRALREEIRQQLNVILHGATGSENDQETETISAMFPGGPDIVKRPVMHPYGFASRSIPGTISVVAKVGSDIQNRMTIGHRDSKRPSDLDQGECAMYSSTAKAVYVRNDKVQVGTMSSDSPMVLGDVLLNALTDIMNAFLNAAQVGQCAVGPVVLDPSVRTALQQALMKYVQQSSTNVVSQLTFTERGP